jgi:hypothetical protein
MSALYLMVGKCMKSKGDSWAHECVLSNCKENVCGN